MKNKTYVVIDIAKGQGMPLSASDDPMKENGINYKMLSEESFSINDRKFSFPEVDCLILHKTLLVTGKESESGHMRDKCEWINQLSLFTDNAQIILAKSEDFLSLRACAENLAVALKTRIYTSLDETRLKNVYAITRKTKSRNWDEINSSYYEMLLKNRNEILSGFIQTPAEFKVKKNSTHTSISYSMPYTFSLNMPLNKTGCFAFLLFLLTGFLIGDQGLSKAPGWLIAVNIGLLALIFLHSFYYRYFKYLTVEVAISKSELSYKEVFNKNAKSFVVKSDLLEEIQIIKRKGLINKYSEFKLITDKKVYNFTLPQAYAAPLKRCIDKAILHC